MWLYYYYGDITTKTLENESEGIVTEVKYKEINGTSYKKGTSDDVISVLEDVRGSNVRVRIFIGDTKTGKSWLEEHDIEGYVGRSTGTIKIPILIHNIRSHGGGGILDHCIIRIIEMKTHRVLYSHSKFHTGELTIKECKIPREEVDGKMTFYRAEVYVDGGIHARFTTMKKAQRWVKKISG